MYLVSAFLVRSIEWKEFKASLPTKVITSHHHCLSAACQTVAAVQLLGHYIHRKSVSLILNDKTTMVCK